MSVYETLLSTQGTSSPGVMEWIVKCIERLPYICRLTLIMRATLGSKTNSYVTEAKANSDPFAWLEVEKYERGGNVVSNPWALNVSWLPTLNYLQHTT